MSGVGSRPALATCETRQVLLAGVPGGFSRGSPVFAPPTDWPVSYELNFTARSILETEAFTWEKVKTMDFLKKILQPET